jgi:hypothetical protein
VFENDGNQHTLLITHEHVVILDRKQKNILYWFTPDEIMDIKIVLEGFKVLYKREQNDYVSPFFNNNRRLCWN